MIKKEAANLIDSVHEWIERAYNPGSWRAKQDCFQIHLHVDLPDESVCDLLSIRHCN